MTTKRLGAAAAIATSAALLGSSAFAAPPAPVQGPSSSQSPYLVSLDDSISMTSVITVGDVTPNGYKAVGIMDGLGAYDNGDSTFTVLMNHELGADKGVARAHGAIGSFVSKWTIEKDTYKVIKGEDLIKKVMIGNPADGTFAAGSNVVIGRLCSGDLPDPSAFFNKASGKGTQDRIFMSGEEVGAEGRAMAHVVTGAEAGTSYVLPWLGKASWENLVALPNSGDKTVVLGLDDSGGGQVYAYVGDKRTTGNPVERAGLVGGKLYGLKIDTVATETDATTIPAAGVKFSFVEIPGAASMTGAQLETASTTLGVSKLARPEDGQFDPTSLNRFYFATTASFNGISRVWQLNFADIANPMAGGTTVPVIQSPAYDAAKANEDQAGPRMMDNLTVDSRGRVLVQEDPGNQRYVSGIWEYVPSTKELFPIAKHDPARFGPANPPYVGGILTNDEESSGIIELPFLGQGVFLADVQAHYATDAETVEGGQLLVMDSARNPALLTATAASVTAGQAGTVKVTVDPATAKGTAELLNGTKVLGTATVTSGAASFTVPANALPVGTTQLTVRYWGDKTNDPATSTVAFTVAAPVATATATVTAKPTATPTATVTAKPTATATATATATVTATPKPTVTPSATATVKENPVFTVKRTKPAKGGVAKVQVFSFVKSTNVATGTVSVSGKGVKASSTTVRDGVAVSRLTFAKPGKYKVTVTYSGNDKINAATKTITVNVKR